MLEQGAGNAEPLLLPAGNIHAALAHVGIQAVRHPLQKSSSAQAARQAAQQGFVIGVGITPAQVVTDGAGEQQVLLQHNAHSIPQGSKGIPAHILPADLDGAGGGIVQAGESAVPALIFAAPVPPIMAHRLAPAGMCSVTWAKGIPGRSGTVFEADVRKSMLPSATAATGSAGVASAGCSSSTARMRRALVRERVSCQKHAGEHHDRVEHLQNIAQKRRSARRPSSGRSE